MERRLRNNSDHIIVGRPQKPRGKEFHFKDNLLLSAVLLNSIYHMSSFSNAHSP